MKSRIGILVLILVCLGLGAAWIITSKKASERQREATDRIGALSNNVVAINKDLADQRNVNNSLERTVEERTASLTELSNHIAQTTAKLAGANANLAKTEASLQAAEDEIKKREARITELENQNQALDKQALDLSGAITNLTVQIAETQRKLAASEGDKAFLEKELKRLMGEKAELERQFNDLAVLRAQVAHLKEELSIARRIDWIRRGLFATSEEKGAARLMRPAAPPVPPKTSSGDLNVEVSSEGTARVVPPSTNSPATNTPAK